MMMVRLRRLPPRHATWPYPLLFFFLTLSAVLLVAKSRHPIPLADVRRPSRLSLISFFLTDLNSSRVPFLHSYIESHVHIGGILFEYYFVNFSIRNLTDPPSLAPSRRYRELVELGVTWSSALKRGKSCELMAKFLFAMDYFLSQTSAKWLWRGTDDTVINFRELPPFVEELERLHDPLTERVVLGNCLTNSQQAWLVNGRAPTYLQGGSGYFMSRSAVAGIVPAGRQIVVGMEGLEDAVFGAFLQSIGIEMEEASSPAFLGYNIKKYDFDVLLRRRYSYLAVCRRVNQTKRPCRQFRARLRNVVFFHQHAEFGESLLTKALAVFDAHPSVKWSVPEYAPVICRSRDRPPP
jgi:hypothetical protein